MDIERELIYITRRLVSARERAGLTQTEAAQRVGLARASSLSPYETGASVPTLALFLKLCEVYEISPVRVLTGLDDGIDYRKLARTLDDMMSELHKALDD